MRMAANTTKVKRYRRMDTPAMKEIKEEWGRAMVLEPFFRGSG
jgi:hypothetical protein